jgi:hypothetical protein
MLACASFQCEYFPMATADTIKLAASLLAQRGASKRTPQERSEAARQAARARWDRLRECTKHQRKVIL